MANKRHPTLRAQWLGKLLRDLRESNAMTLKEAGDYIQRNPSTLSRFESGDLPINRADVLSLLNLYGVDGEHQRKALLQLADEISKTGWWEKYSKDVFQRTIDYVWLENRAQHIRIFSPFVVPGLLQTREYAYAVVNAGDPPASQQQIERWVEMRMTRQNILQGDSPTQLSVILDEATLHRLPGSRESMARQCRRLAEMATRSTVEIRVLPFEAGIYANPDGEFTLIKLPDPFPQVAHIDSAAGMIFLEREDVTKLTDLYGRLRDKCLSTTESISFITAKEKDLS
ncbi:helix-turn-helix domain-containing protein [Marinactinospora rubrisoli]|uniref:Helix-turn-helix domain-containing protein n=1 Tax=Marinactinospora rubrisoli TaxID=2715399 RepID=A0ABW2KDY6_9ACTN